MSKRILIAGAGANQVGMIETARSMGWTAVAADANPAAPGLKLAGPGRAINITDPEALAALAREQRVDGIFPAAELAVEAVAEAAEMLGLPGIPIPVAERMRNKRAMRQRLAAKGLPGPQFAGVRSLDEAMSAAAEIGFPIIVKPADGNASKGVQRVDHTESLPGAFQNAFVRSRIDEVLIESFMEGDEFGVDVLVYKGRYLLGGITHKIRSAPPNRYDLGLFMPPDLSDEAVALLERTVAEALAAVGFENGTTHCEVILSAEGPRIVEMAGRPGGARIPTDLIPLAYGWDFIADALRIAVGCAPAGSRQYERGSAIYWAPAEPGVVQRVDGEEEARALPGVRDAAIHVKPGDVIEPTVDCVTRDGIGYVLVEGATRAEAVANAERALDAIRIESAPMANDMADDGTGAASPWTPPGSTPFDKAGGTWRQKAGVDIEPYVEAAKASLAAHGFALLPPEERPQGVPLRDFIAQFGAIMPQYNGEYVYSVKAAQGYNSFSDSKSTNAIPPHTDGSDMLTPPHTMALYGVHAASCGGGATLLADGYAFVETLEPRLRDELAARIYRFGSKQGIHAERPFHVDSPIFTEDYGGRGPMLRFSYNLLRFGDYSAQADGAEEHADAFTLEICQRAMAYFEQHAIQARIKTGDVLLWDNWRMLHSREAYHDAQRHLRRYWLDS